MIGTVLSIVMGGLPGIAREIAKARTDAINAQTEQQKIEAEERVKILEARAKVMVAEADTPWNAIARFLLISPFVVILWQYIVWDKIMCKWFTSAADAARACSTDDLSPNLWYLMFVIFGFYFVQDVAKIVRR
jgi:hypothetical protein